MNKCFDDILNMRQYLLKNVSYNYGNLFGITNIGKQRKKQEDSILIGFHPLIPDFKILAVADGMGGLNCGAKASSITLYKLLKWFIQLNISDYNNMLEIEKKFIDEINIIDSIVRHECDGGGTTLSLALVLKNETFLASIGDSRIYIYNGNLKQQNEDYTISWDLYNKGIIKEKNYIRFHKKNNLLLSSVGCEKKKLNIEKKYIYNDIYDSLFIFSDGVTDCLSEEELLNIIKYSNYDNCLKNIIDFSISNNSFLDINNLDYYNKIDGGKDNASAVALIKRKERR